MEPLYQTFMRLTFEEYRRMYWTLNRTRSIVRVLIMWAVFILLGVMLRNAFYIAFCLVIPFLEYYPMNRALKKTYYSNQMAVNAELEYQFYDSYFVKKSKAGEEQIDYDKLYKTIETKSRFYLMLGNNQGYILAKENFPEGLADFLKNLRAKA